jgi:hypothetical protein
VYIKLVVLLRNYVTMMHGQQNIKNGWATIVVVGRLRVNSKHTDNFTFSFPFTTGIIKMLVICHFQIWFVLTFEASAHLDMGSESIAETKTGQGPWFPVQCKWGVTFSGDTIQLKALTYGMGVILTFPKSYLWHTWAEIHSDTLKKIEVQTKWVTFLSLNIRLTNFLSP